MEITLNNRKEKLDFEKITVQELLDIKKFTFKMIIVKVNGTLVEKSDYKNKIIKEGDKVDVIHLMSGG